MSILRSSFPKTIPRDQIRDPGTAWFQRITMFRTGNPGNDTIPWNCLVSKTMLGVKQFLQVPTAGHLKPKNLMDTSATRMDTSATRIEAFVELFGRFSSSFLLRILLSQSPKTWNFSRRSAPGLKACMLDSLTWTKGEMCRECQKSRKKFPNARGDFFCKKTFEKGTYILYLWDFALPEPQNLDFSHRH